MEKFEEQYVELVAMMGKVPEPLRAEILAALSEASDLHEAEMQALTKSSSKEVAALQRKLEKQLEKSEEQHDRLLREAADKNDEPRSAVALGILWDTTDGRLLLEQAYKQNPKLVRMALNYLGGSLIEGELRDQAKAEYDAKKKADEEKKKIN